MTILYNTYIIQYKKLPICGPLLTTTNFNSVVHFIFKCGTQEINISALTIWQHTTFLVICLLDSSTLRMGSTGCPETSVRNYRCSLSNSPEE